MSKKCKSAPRPTNAERTAATANFEPPIKGGLTLSAEVERLRADSKERNEQITAIVQPRIEEHLLTYQMVVDALVDAHRRIAETMDFGLGDETRWTAVWEMSGRCLGLCGCLLVQLRGGFASETVPTMRSIHEAAQLLAVLVGPGEEPLLSQWLNDTSYIKTATARAAEGRIEKPRVTFLREQGIELHGNQAELGSQIYDILSKPAHNMRSGFKESVAVQLKTFSYGSHPDPTQRAVHVEFGGQLIEEITIRVGTAFATRFLGRPFYENTVKRLIAEIEAIRETMPVNPPAMKRLREAS